ncbi:MAG: hypothetical protein AB7S46_17790, partial [Flavobacteriaceae bacterium]
VSRVLRLTLLSPNIPEAVLDGHQSSDFLLRRLTHPFPNEWTKQAPLYAACAITRPAAGTYCVA